MPNIPTFENVGGFSTQGSHKKKMGGSANFSFLQQVNLPFFIVLTLLVIYGLAVCASAVSGNSQYSFARQLMGLGMGIVIFISLMLFNYKFFEKLTIPLLVVSVVLILSPHLPVIGVSAMGARSWVRIGMQFQPGELAKVTVILFAASLVTKNRDKLGDLKEYCKTVCMLAIPFVCILTQPDLGTGLVYFIICAVVVTVGGAKGRYVIGTILLIVVAFLAILVVDEVLKTQASDGTYEYKLLRNYQRNRLFVFLNQNDTDSSGEGYNLAQAMIAIGSGGAFGKGLGNATQSSLGFLPEAPTDFIFCVLCEELGFLGAVVLIILYLCLIFITIKIGKQSSDVFGMLICVGVSAMWLFQILENIGMCCAVMPITGIPLPFVSYGSSFMIVNFACSGLVANVWKTSMAQSVPGKRKEVKHAKII